MAQLPFAFITAARAVGREMIARSGDYPPDLAEKLTEAGRALFAAIQVVDAVPPRAKRGQARWQRSVLRAMRRR